MKRISILLFLFLPLFSGWAQTVTLDSCWTLAENNYPRIREFSLLEKMHDLEQKNINKNWLPDFSLIGAASYVNLSPGIEFSMGIPGVPSQQIGIDQDIYTALLMVDQVIYAGGAIKSQKALQESILKVNQQQLNIELFHLKKRVNDIYFRILLFNKNITLIDELILTFSSRISEIKVAVNNGATLQIVVDDLMAETLRAEQKRDELVANRDAFYKVLSILTGKEINYQTKLISPKINFDGAIAFENRPENLLFALKKEQVDKQSILLNSANMPKIAGLGVAGEAMMKDANSLFYVGLTMQWDILNWNLNKNKKQQLGIQKERIDTEIATFGQSVTIEMAQINGKIEQYNRLLERDLKIIELKSKVLKVANSQLKNGVITSADYVQYLHQETDAKIDFETHNTSLLEAKLDFMMTTGKVQIF